MKVHMTQEQLDHFHRITQMAIDARNYRVRAEKALTVLKFKEAQCADALSEFLKTVIIK